MVVVVVVVVSCCRFLFLFLVLVLVVLWLLVIGCLSMLLDGVVAQENGTRARGRDQLHSPLVDGEAARNS